MTLLPCGFPPRLLLRDAGFGQLSARAGSVGTASRRRAGRAKGWEHASQNRRSPSCTSGGREARREPDGRSAEAQATTRTALGAARPEAAARSLGLSVPGWREPRIGRGGCRLRGAAEGVERREERNERSRAGRARRESVAGLAGGAFRKGKGSGCPGGVRGR